MSSALLSLMQVMMRPMWNQGSTDFREELRSYAGLIDQAISEAFEGGELLRDKEEVLAALDASKAVLQRNYLARHRFRNSGIADADRGLYFTFSKSRFLRDYLALYKSKSLVVCCLFMTQQGEVWGALATLKSSNLEVRPFCIVQKARAPAFLEDLTRYGQSLSTGLPNKIALESILQSCGHALIPRLIEIAYPDKIVFVPHRRLHIIPWHAAYLQKSDRTRLYVGDIIDQVSYASSVFELLWANWLPKGSRAKEPTGTLHVIDLSASDLPWVALEHEYVRGMRELGFPVQIVTRHSELPKSMESYLRITWSSHAASCPNGWGQSALFLGNKPVRAETIMSKWNLPYQPTVSLGACETAFDASAPEDSDEYCGLDLALRVAGAGAVASTMWSIADPVAALGNLLVVQYELADGISTSQALCLFQRYLRSGEWYQHLPTEEQMEQLISQRRGTDQMRRVVHELRQLDPRELQGMEYWACWRCVSA